MSNAKLYFLFSDNEPPVFQNCPQQPIIVQTDVNGGLLPVNFTEPTATDNSGAIARLEVTPQHFRTPIQVFHNMVVRYVAFDFDGNVAICEVNITVPDYTPPKLSCPQSYVIELVDKQDSYAVNFNETRRRINATDASGEVFLKFIPERAVIPIRGYENVTVIASDKYGNKAQCHFQVSHMLQLTIIFLIYKRTFLDHISHSRFRFKQHLV